MRLGIEREHTDRLKNIAVIGVKTFGWTFVNRGLEVPADVPYVRLAALCAVRGRYPVLRVGRQYTRQTRIPGTGFVFQGAGELVAWSRILDNQEALCVVNPNGEAHRGGDVVVSAELWSPGTEFTVVANTAQAAVQGAFAGSHPVDSKVVVQGQSHAGEPAYIQVRDIPPGEVIVFVKEY